MNAAVCFEGGSYWTLCPDPVSASGELLSCLGSEKERNGGRERHRGRDRERESEGRGEGERGERERERKKTEMGSVT